MGNLFRTGMLMAALTALFMAIGYWVAGVTGIVVALGIAAVANVIAYWTSDRAVLAVYGAREVTWNDAPELVGLVAHLAQTAAMPMPKVFIIENEQPNAFATGRNPDHAAVAVTTGLLRLLDQAELNGVLAHELSHIRHHDTLTMTITATLAGAIGMLANFAFFFGGGHDDRRGGALGGLLLLILAPLAATLVQMAISRTREFSADAGAAELTKQPLALARALARISQTAEHIPNEQAEHNPATAPLFIINPLSGAHLGSLFATHPPAEERIARLRHMAQYSVPETVPR